MNKLPLIYAIALVSGLMASTLAVACELHAGFGGGWSRYGQHSNASLTPPSELPVHKLVLNTPAMVNTQEGETTELTINYAFASDADNPVVELSLDLGDALTTKGSKRVMLSGKNAEHVFVVSASRTGIHRIGVTAQSMEPYEPVQGKDVIFVRVSKN